MDSFVIKGNKYTFDAENNNIIVEQDSKVWRLADDFKGFFAFNSEGKAVGCPFAKAKEIKRELYEDGVSYGLRCDFRGFEIEGESVDFAYTTLIWVHKTNGRVYFELIPVNEPKNISHAVWPCAWEFVRTDALAYTLFPSGQGELIPSNWPADVCSAGHRSFNDVRGIMPWFSQIDRGNAYLAIVETPWDANHWYTHKGESESPTTVYAIWTPSMGKLDYKRITRTEFFRNADYVTVAKAYRQYVIDNGSFYTLEQKALANPKIRELLGSPVIHSHIYYWIKPEAAIYDKEHPENNYKFKTFEECRKQIEALTARGLKKAYFHLDGWINEGYDQQHPDILPPCPKAGGIEEFKKLHESCKKGNIMLALHDQYRDYYLDTPSFDLKNAVLDVNGGYGRHCVWNGGDQVFLCETLAEYYVARNYDMLEEMGFKPDGVYLDVFACTRLDECLNPMHKMTKRECVRFRQKCMALLAARGIVMSSEAGVDAYLPYLALCHHTYNTGMYAKEERFCPKFGVSVPLFNLVYHDAFIVPWPYKYPYEGDLKMSEYRFLDSLLNGGPGYLAIDADDEEFAKVNIASELFGKVGFAEMTKHEFLSDDYKVQKTTYSNGISVTVDYNSMTYSIEE